MRPHRRWDVTLLAKHPLRLPEKPRVGIGIARAVTVHIGSLSKRAFGRANGERGVMCRRVVCETCQKPSFSGCGRHVEEVLIAVPREARCSCRKGQAAQQAVRNEQLIAYAVSA